MLSIQDKIEQACKTAGINKTELAKRLGTSQPALSQRLKNGKFSDEDFKKIAEALGATYYSGFKFLDSEDFDYLTAFFTNNIEGICKNVNIKDNVEVVESVRKMYGLGKILYKQGSLNTLVSLVKDGLLSLSDASRKANMSEADFSQLMKHEENGKK